MPEIKNRKFDRIYKGVYLFTAASLFGGAFYLIFEMIFRQLTNRTALHPYSGLMFLMGTMSFIGIVMFYKVFPPKMFVLKALTGGAWITATEAAFGFLMLDVFGTRSWDYTGHILQFRGVICLRWSLVWVALSAVAIFSWETWVAEKLAGKKLWLFGKIKSKKPVPEKIIPVH